MFWIAYLSSQNTGKYMYSLKIPIPHPIFPSTATQYFWPRVTSHKPLFDICHNQLQRLFPPILFLFLLQFPGYPHILVPSKDDVKPIKQASQIPMFNIFEKFQRVPQQSERPYLKETQLKCKPETPWNAIRLLLFDKCQFTRPLNWKKCWTRRTTHWPHIYQIWNQNLVLAISP